MRDEVYNYGSFKPEHDVRGRGHMQPLPQAAWGQASDAARSFRCKRVRGFWMRSARKVDAQ